MAKGRSPNCPQVALAEAIERVQKVYRAEHTHSAERQVIAHHLGYKSLNGASLTLLGALRQYGLLTDEGGDLRVSDEAVTIIELSRNDHEYIDALAQCAYKPSLFNGLREQFGDILPSEANLRHALIKKGFLPRTADSVIRVYRENTQFLQEQGIYTGSEHQMSTQSQQPAAAREPRMITGAASITNPGLKSQPDVHPSDDQVKVGFDIPVTRDCTMGVSATGTVTQEGIEKFIAYLNLIKDAFPTQEDIEKEITRAGTRERAMESLRRRKANPERYADEFEAHDE